nr:MAG TPA: hypothetical protein [Caudoviricetes sp.]
MRIFRNAFVILYSFLSILCFTFIYICYMIYL